MGEHAEMRLDGTLCEGCGEYIGPGEGFARYCSRACEPAGYRDSDFEPFPNTRARLKAVASENGFDDLLDELSKPAKERCLHCRQLVSSPHGMKPHIRAKHPELGCPHCAKVCKTRQGLTDHIAAKHPGAAEQGSKEGKRRDG